jgi:hypothetical protein
MKSIIAMVYIREANIFLFSPSYWEVKPEFKLKNCRKGNYFHHPRTSI